MNRILLIALLVAFPVTSCVPIIYYQVYKVNTDSRILKDDKSLVFEDENCKISYNLWVDKGNIGFAFFNKTDKNIFLNLDNSYFVLNGIANPYFRNRTFTSSTSHGISPDKGETASTVVSYTEENVICIPAKTSRIVKEFAIYTDIIRNCDLFRYPNNKQIKTISLTENNSPIKFRNRLAYSIEKSGDQVTVENSFFVSEITNLPENDAYEMKYEELCGQKGDSKVSFFKGSAPDKFYIRYIKGVENWKH